MNELHQIRMQITALKRREELLAPQHRKLHRQAMNIWDEIRHCEDRRIILEAQKFFLEGLINVISPVPTPREHTMPTNKPHVKHRQPRDCKAEAKKLMAQLSKAEMIEMLKELGG